MAKLLVAILFLSIGLVVLGSGLLSARPDGGLGRPGALTASGLSVTLIVTGLVVAVTALAIAAWWSPTARLLRIIRESRPGEFVFVSQTSPTAQRFATDVLGVRRLPTYVVCAAKAVEIEIWATSALPPVRISSDDVIGVEVETIVLARALPAVGLRIAGWNELVHLVPCRDRWELFAILTRSGTLAVASELEARLTH